MCAHCMIHSFTHSLCRLFPTVNPAVWQRGVNVAVERTFWADVQSSVVEAGSLNQDFKHAYRNWTHWEEKGTRWGNSSQWCHHWFPIIPALHLSLRKMIQSCFYILFPLWISSSNISFVTIIVCVTQQKTPLNNTTPQYIYILTLCFNYRYNSTTWASAPNQKWVRFQTVLKHWTKAQQNSLRSSLNMDPDPAVI